LNNRFRGLHSHNKKIRNIRQYNTHIEPITFANGNKIYSKYIGTYHGIINNKKIELKDVLYVPESNKNLISISKLIKQK